MFFSNNFEFNLIARMKKRTYLCVGNFKRFKKQLGIKEERGLKIEFKIIIHGMGKLLEQRFSI